MSTLAEVTTVVVSILIENMTPEQRVRAAEQIERIAWTEADDREERVFLARVGDVLRS